MENNNMNNVIELATATTTTVYLDEQYRTPGIDHLDQYRDSIFYNLLSKSIKERGNAYEEICAKILRKEGYDAKVAPASFGEYDLIVDGMKVELKTSRKASQYDTRGRQWQFPCIREGNYDVLFLMTIDTDDTVNIYSTTYDAILPFSGKTDKKNSSRNLAVKTDMQELPADLIVSVQMK